MSRRSWVRRNRTTEQPTWLAENLLLQLYALGQCDCAIVIVAHRSQGEHRCTAQTGNRTEQERAADLITD